MKSECCNAEVKWANLVPYCTKCRKKCEGKLGHQLKSEKEGIKKEIMEEWSKIANSEKYNHYRLNVHSNLFEDLADESIQELKRKFIELLNDLKYNSNDLLEYKKRIKQQVEKV